MVVTRSMSGTTKKTDIMIAVNHQVVKTERASKQTKKKERTNWAVMDIAHCIFMNKETFIEQHPHVKITSEVIKAGEKEWISMSDTARAPYVIEAEKTLVELVEAYKQASSSNMIVTRAKSGKSKKVDTKNVVKQHKLAERARKKTSAKERRLLDSAFSIFIIETFRKEYREKHPEALLSVIVYAGQDRWLSMSDRDKAPYIELAKKRDAEEHEIYRKMKKGEYV